MAFVPAAPLATHRTSVSSHNRVSCNPLRTRTPTAPRTRRAARTIAPTAELRQKRDGSQIRGKVFVVKDNIDTDQIIPAEYLTLVPSNPDEYRKLGSFAMNGLPQELYPTRYVAEGQFDTEYPIIVAGDNFGCGSSREHAPVAIGAAGGCAVIAESYARIFFRNCSATGELYPWESVERLVDCFKTGDVAAIDFDREIVINESTGKEYSLNPLGDIQPVIDAGGIFEFARRSGMIKKK